MSKYCCCISKSFQNEVICTEMFSQKNIFNSHSKNENIGGKFLLQYLFMAIMGCKNVVCDASLKKHYRGFF